MITRQRKRDTTCGTPAATNQRRFIPEGLSPVTVRTPSKTPTSNRKPRRPFCPSPTTVRQMLNSTCESGVVYKSMYSLGLGSASTDMTAMGQSYANTSSRPEESFLAPSNDSSLNQSASALSTATDKLDSNFSILKWNVKSLKSRRQSL